MATADASFQQPRTLSGIGVSLAVHALLLGLWQLSRPVAVPDDGEPRRVQFLRLLPAPAAERGAPALPSSVRSSASSARIAPAARATPPVSSQSLPEPAAEPLALPAIPAADAPPAPAISSADLLRAARAEAGAADRALRAENPRRGIRAPIETAQMKLERGIAHAAEMAPNRWYQAPKTQEILDPGGYGRRRHKVITATGTYCVTYESNHGPDGRDTMRDGIPPKFTNCPPHEEPAKAQKWD
ncbi:MULTISPECIES: hypothetical protein [unclassified Massilia]|uniref:hypothetical protein n=1 Tax=unclassified Massilia TaxID=2609279 RepID=UPI00177E88D3|nr:MULTISPECIES: hypothetical protein [unclassified Massilia]MBD8532519.1 hypothetical protein [Massilia sp. CFBP 13647]MBD8675890.1 hypothetical protein [Massilia sp. CFBP 13721]